MQERKIRRASIALLLATGLSGASAGFVDERQAVIAPSAKAALAPAGKAAAGAVPAASGSLHGDFRYPGWTDLAPPAPAGLTLAAAIANLLPPKHPSVSIHADEALLKLPVYWSAGAGVTRRDALSNVAQLAGVQISVVGSTVIIAAAPATVAAQGSAAQGWEILSTDVRLATAFERWARRGGYSLRWDAERHALIEGSHTFDGNFESAVKAALETPGIANSAYPLESCIYPNTPPLLRITRRGEQAKDCPIVD